MNRASLVSKSIFCVIVSSFVFLALGIGIEIYFRQFTKYRTSAIVFDPLVGWRYKQHLAEKRGLFSLNGHAASFFDGKQDKTGNSFQKAGGRILFLGDSYTAGLHVPANNVFPKLIEDNLKGKTKDSFQIINCSVSAWATDQQLLFFESEGFKFRPDYVILMMAPGDIREMFVKRFITLNSDHELQLNGAPTIPWKDRLFWFLANYSATFQSFQRKYDTSYGYFFGSIFPLFSMDIPFASERGDDDTPLFLRNPPETVSHASQLFRAVIQRLLHTCQKEKCRLLLSVIPTKMEFDGTLHSAEYVPGKISSFVKSIAHENQIPFIDLFSKVEELEEKDRLSLFITEEYHFNRKGHRFVARIISEYILKMPV